MNRKRIILTGALGRMGRELVRLISLSEDCALVGALERPWAPDMGKDIGDLVLGKAMGVRVADDLGSAAEAADVLLDFSQADATAGFMRQAAEHGLAVVSGVTGLKESAEAEMARASAKVPILWSSNMALGVNLLLTLAKLMPPVLGKDFDMEIVEIHHRHKKDAPSGTALSLARALGSEARPVPMHSLRMGEAVGEHQIHFVSPLEEIRITHRALSRGAFAGGALRAALWLCGRPPGRYTMLDVLGLADLMSP